MSVQRDRFEAEVRKPQPNWETVIDNLNALAMFEMLPALAGLQPAIRNEVVNQSRRILRTQRGWRGSCDRIEFAADVINDQRVTSWPSDLPNEQVEDARNFLASLLRPATNQAGREVFPTADAAAIAAIQETSPISVAINREFSGSIFKRGSRFGFTPPVRGGERDSDPNVPVPPRTTAVGIYHMHGNSNGPGAETFSGDDMVICGRLGRFSYLGTPSGRIKKLIPSNLMSSEERRQNPLGVRQVPLR